jgi:hypothetical protein
VGLLVLVLSLVFGAGQALAATGSGSKLENTVESLLGTKYRYGGTTTKGFDCSGFVRYVFDKLGIDLPRSSREQYKIGQKVAKDELRVGDLVFFNTNGKGVSHVGIYMGDGRFVHSSTNKGVTYTSMSDKYYSKRYLGARRILDDEAYRKLVVALEEANGEIAADGAEGTKVDDAARVSSEEAAQDADEDAALDEIPDEDGIADEDEDGSEQG